METLYGSIVVDLTTNWFVDTWYWIGSIAYFKLVATVFNLFF